MWGDSRLYRLRGSRFQQLTKDHSLRQELVDRGVYTPEEVEEKVGANVVTRAVGVEASVEADAAQIFVLPGDLFLLCSDGLSDMVSDAEVAKLLETPRDDLDDVVEALVAAAHEGGGRDNITVALISVDQAFPLSAVDDSDRLLGERITIAGRTDVGLKRSHNEDFLAFESARGVVVLADGMGGCNAGEVASAVCVSSIMECLGVPSRTIEDG